MRIDHVQLAMPPGREADAVGFFAELVGMTEIVKPEPLRARGGCWFACGAVQLHLGVEDPFTPQRQAHPAFAVDELDGLADRLTTNGHAVRWDQAVPGRRRFYTDDPFGNRIEFIRNGDGFSQR